MLKTWFSAAYKLVLNKYISTGTKITVILDRYDGGIKNALRHVQNI